MDARPIDLLIAALVAVLIASVWAVALVWFVGGFC